MSHHSPNSKDTQVDEFDSSCGHEIAALTLTPFCQLQEDRVSLSLLRVRHHQEEHLDLDPHSPSLAKRHQAWSIQLRLEFSELKKYLVGLGMRTRWEDGLEGFSS